MRDAATEIFSEDERKALSPYFTNLDGPVFALVNLPEVVKGALFARYSRSAKSLRRLFLDEFRDKISPQPVAGTVGLSRARRLYEKVLSDYGDDSVAQLGGVHLACEGVSNILTKVLERGRLAAYLEQSTRYVPYTDRVEGRWKYYIPGELERTALREAYIEVMNRAFETYADLLPRMQLFFCRAYPKKKEISDTVYSAAIRSRALDSVRGLLPAATTSNLGIYASGQAYEALLLHMRASELFEVREYALSSL
jgi:thymidylate synthase ThyX